MRVPCSALLVLSLAAAGPAGARVVSYAPVTDQIATPVQQPRTSPRFDDSRDEKHPEYRQQGPEQANDDAPDPEVPLFEESRAESDRVRR